MDHAVPNGRVDNDEKTAFREETAIDEKKQGALDEDELPRHIGNISHQRTRRCSENTRGRASDEILNRLERSSSFAKDDKLLLAAHLLHGIEERYLEPVHREIIREAKIFKNLLQENTASLGETNNGGWIKQGRRTGRHNFSIDYKLLQSDQGEELSCRIETITHQDLVVPILSVLNESDLYATWLPNYNIPRMKVVKSEKWRQSGRVSQIVNVETEVPWPLDTRQVILKAVACDNIDSYSAVENGDINESLGKDGGRILIRIQSLDSWNKKEEGLNIPAARKGVVRMKVQGGFSIEKFPSDHPLEKCSKRYDLKTKPALRNDQVLVVFSFSVDPHLAAIPKSFINFFLRTAMGQMWNMFLNVAEEVKEGKRPAHSDAIKKKREVLYDWVEERTRVMLRQTPQSSQKT